MLGWWIVVSKQSPSEWDQADQDSRRAARLAQWEAGIDGIDWLTKLVELGRAEQVARSGYPNRYTALARDVLPLLDDKPPAPGGTQIIGDDYATTSRWRGNMERNDSLIGSCSPDQLLTIDAWDQS